MGTTTHWLRRLAAVTTVCLATGCGTEPLRTGDRAATGPAQQESPSATEWTYDTLNAEERAVIDRSRNVAGWDRVHASFAAAVGESSEAARKPGDR
jgi:hypothetical protein